MRKVLIGAIGIMLLIIAPLWKAEAAAGIVQDPDSLLVPPAIQLLEETPFYTNLKDDYPEHPAGTISPQEVQVLSGQRGWFFERNRWLIQTWQGPRWIVTEPGMLDVPAPDTVTLLEETSLYAERDETAEPIASITPQQDVQVAWAEKQWFLHSGKDGRIWVKLHTTWIGDCWARLPIDRIGFIRPVERTAYYSGEMVYDLPVSTSRPANPIGMLEEKYARVTGEFVSPTVRMYRVDTDIGEKWVGSEGIIVEKTAEDVQLKTETPLFEWFSADSMPIGKLEPQTVHAFEKVVLDRDRGDIWYHIRMSDEREGWVNRLYAQPENVTASQLDIHLSGLTKLYAYPREQLALAYDPISAQTVRSDGYWNDESGRRWYRIDSYKGKVWILVDPISASLTVPGEPARLQIRVMMPREQTFSVREDTVTDYNERIGYVDADSGTLFFSLVKMAKQFGYTPASPAEDGAVTVAGQTRYSFKLKAGDLVAETFWNGRKERDVRLEHAPQTVKGELYVSLADAQLLFGAVRYDDGGPWTMLVLKEYGVETSSWPSQLAADRLPLRAFLYDYAGRNEHGGAVLSLELYRAVEADSKRGTNAGTPVRLGSLDGSTTLYELVSELPLQQGSNQLTAVLKAGERVIWKQDIAIRSMP